MIFGVGLLAYFAGKIIVPKLNELSASNQLPALQFPSFIPSPTTTAPPPPQQIMPTTTTTTNELSPIEKAIPTNTNITNPKVSAGSWTFNVVGDVDYFEGTGQNLCGDNPTVAFVIGDFSYDCNAQKWWTTTMKACNGKNVIGSVGNHDCSGKGFIDLFPLNKGQWEFIHKVGNIAFIAVNTGFCNAQCSNPSTSEKYFQQAQADPSVKFIVVHMHKPVFTAGTAPDAPMSFHTMFQKYSKVKMVFAGHNHTYKRYVLQNGIQYITVGRGGHDANGNEALTKGPSSGAVGVAKCRVAPDGSISCQYVANNGTILDQWGLTADGKHTGSGGVTPKQGTASGESATAAYAQAFYTNYNYPTKEERDNAYIMMMDRRIPQRKFNNTIYHYSTRVIR